MSRIGKEPITLPQGVTVNVNGNDVVECGFSGRRISETMNNVLDLVMRGTLRNSKYDLLEYIKGLV